MQDSYDLDASRMIAIDDQIRAYRPEAHTFGCQIGPHVSSLRPSGKLLEGFKKLVDYAFRRLDIIESYEVADDLQVVERFGRELVERHFPYLCGPRRRRARASWAPIPWPASNCCKPRSIFSRTWVRRCSFTWSCSSSSRTSSRLTS